TQIFRYLNTLPPWVRRKHGQAYESRNLLPSLKSGRSSCGIWGAISLDFKSQLVILSKDQRMNSKLYITRVLNPAAHPFYQKVMEHRGDTIWQEDVAKYHAARATRAHQKALGMALLEWPA